MPEPDWTNDQLEDPDSEDNVVQLVALQFTEHCKADAEKKNATNYCVRYVVYERHLADGSQSRSEPF